MKNIMLCCLFGIFSIVAHANYELSVNGKKVICYGEDNVAIVLNAKRTSLTETWEGETVSTKKIFDVKSDDATYTNYKTVDGTLSLSDDGDTYQYGDDEASSVDCE